MSQKRPRLSSDDNQPKLREPKPPFGLERKRWNRLRLRLFGAAALLASGVVLWMISRRGESVDEHRIQGQRLASHYEVVSEAIGCESPSSQESASPFIGVHQGFPVGPVLVDCGSPAICQTVSQRDPELLMPALVRGPLDDVNWAEWASPPVILEETPEGDWAASQSRSWEQEDTCHTVERQEAFTLSEGRLTQTVEVLFASSSCETGTEPVLACVFRRVRELRAPRR